MNIISSKIDEILSKDKFSLEELLEDDEIIIETKNQNKALLDLHVSFLQQMRYSLLTYYFSLSKPEVTKKMLGYVLNKAKEDDDERIKILYI